MNLKGRGDELYKDMTKLLKGELSAEQFARNWSESLYQIVNINFILPFYKLIPGAEGASDAAKDINNKMSLFCAAFFEK